MAEFAQYREITNRLKKRFTLRKPNYREASESFSKLSAKLGSFPDYAGYCLLSAAQCEHNIVLGYKEQLSSAPLIGPSGSTFAYNSSSGSVSATTTSTSKTAAKSGASSRHHDSKHSIGLERLMHVASESEFNTILEVARLFRRSKQIDQAIVAYAQACKISLPKMSTAVYYEFGTMYEDLGRYQEAGEIFLEAGLYRQAANSLLLGLYLEDAYQCYLELFRQCREHQLSLTSSLMPDTAASSGGVGSSKLHHGSNNKLNEESDQLSRCGLFANDHLTIDDYITIFLLRLYLYDPVKYDYTLPIIPVPAGVVRANLQFPTQTNSTSEEEEHSSEDLSASRVGVSGEFSSRRRLSTTHASTMDEFNLETMMLPYIDWTTRGPQRSVERLIELNMLLETLLFSYRHELKRTIDAVDNEFACQADDELDDEVEIDEKATSVGSIGGLSLLSRPETSHDGSSLLLHEDDDDDVGSLISETDLTDFSVTLQDMARKLVITDLQTNQPEGDEAQDDVFAFKHNTLVLDKTTKSKLINQARRTREGGECFLIDQDDRLRHQVAVKLCPLLNKHQNMILYFIIRDKQ